MNRAQDNGRDNTKNCYTALARRASEGGKAGAAENHGRFAR